MPLLLRDPSPEKRDSNASALALRAQGHAASLPVGSGTWSASRFLSSTGKTVLGHIKYGVRTVRPRSFHFLVWLREHSLEEAPGDSGLALLPLQEKAKGSVFSWESSSNSICSLLPSSFSNPPSYLPGQVKGSVWPYRALGEHREQWTGVSTSLRQPAHPGPSPTLQSLCLELAPWWSYTSADVPKVEVKFVFKHLKKMQKAVVVMAIFGCLFSSFFFLVLNICHIYLCPNYTNPPTAEQQFES